MPRFIKVKAHPGSKEDRLASRAVDSFEIWVRAPAERGLANAAVLVLLASHLRIEAKRLRIIKGAQSPSKIVSVLGKISP